jgi:hypothetical protein
MKQWLTDLPFKCLDVRADRWLGDAELHGRQIETAAINDGLEDVEPTGARGDHDAATAGTRESRRGKKESYISVACVMAVHP